MTGLTVGVDKKRTPGHDVGIGLGCRGNGSANSAQDVGLDGVPSSYAADFQLLPAGAGRGESGDVGILRNAIRQHDQSEAAGDVANISLEILFFIEDRRPVQSPQSSGVALRKIRML